MEAVNLSYFKVSVKRKNIVLFSNIVRIEFSPADHINDNNGHYDLMETTDCKIYTFTYGFQDIVL